MIPALVLTEPQLDALAGGGGDAATIRLLRASRYTKNILLVQALLDAVDHTGGAAARTLPAAYALLATVQRPRPDVVTAVLGHPHVSLWAADCLRTVDTAPAGGLDDSSSGYLACLAVSAALQAGQPFDITLPVRGAAIPLPGLGTVTLPASAHGAAVTLRGDMGRVAAVVPGETVLHVDIEAGGPGWLPLTRLRGPRPFTTDDTLISAVLDDRDPYRAPHRLPATSPLLPAPPLTDGERRRWQELFRRAALFLAVRHRRHAPAMAAGLYALVPMTTRPGTQGHSATALDAFGTVLLTEPANHLSLALTLLHEFQHAKLAALTDLVKLHHADATPRFFAPWRDDPRPFDALLQGAYAHLAVAEFWREQSQGPGSQQATAPQAQFAACRDDLRMAIDQLTESGALTAAGERFVAGMATALDGWQADPLPANVLRLAADRRATDRLTWQVRHLQPDPDAVAQLASQWLAEPGGPRPGPVTVPRSLRPGRRAARGSVRHLSALQAATMPNAVDRQSQASAGDLAFARGHYAVALRAYLSELAAAPADPGTWAGLALASRQPLLVDQPELVRAVYLRVRELGGQPPDPVALADWLTPREHIGGETP